MAIVTFAKNKAIKQTVKTSVATDIVFKSVLIFVSINSPWQDPIFWAAASQPRLRESKNIVGGRQFAPSSHCGGAAYRGEVSNLNPNNPTRSTQPPVQRIPTDPQPPRRLRHIAAHGRQRFADAGVGQLAKVAA